MNQGYDQTRRGFQSTRATVDERRDTLETNAQQLFDLKHQMSERPWMMFGAAVAAGYVLGSMGGGEEQRWHGSPATTTDYNQHAYDSYQRRDTSREAERSGGAGLLSQFDDEMNLLKTAAVATLTSFLRDKIREYMPALGEQLKHQLTDQLGKSPSTAQGASRSYNPSASEAINTEAIPTTTSYGSNLVDRGSEHAKPYYPPGSSGASGKRDYEKTYHPPSETERERGVGDDKF